MPTATRDNQPSRAAIPAAANARLLLLAAVWALLAMSPAQALQAGLQATAPQGVPPVMLEAALSAAVSAAGAAEAEEVRQVAALLASLDHALPAGMPGQIEVGGVTLPTQDAASNAAPAGAKTWPTVCTYGQFLSPDTSFDTTQEIAAGRIESRVNALALTPHEAAIRSGVRSNRSLR